MKALDAIKKTKEPQKTESIGARITEDLKAWVEGYCKREGIKSISKLIEAMLLDLREANKGNVDE